MIKAGETRQKVYHVKTSPQSHQSKHAFQLQQTPICREKPTKLCIPAILRTSRFSRSNTSWPRDVTGVAVEPRLIDFSALHVCAIAFTVNVLTFVHPL